MTPAILAAFSYLRGMLRLGVVVLLAGCDAVFGLHRVGPVNDAAPVDAPVDAPADAPDGCELHDYVSSVVDDTMLLDDEHDQCDPSIRYGAATTINVGQNGSSRVLMRFALDNEAQQAITQGTAIRAQLKITLRPNDCQCTNQPTNFQIFAATHGWYEGNGAAHDGAGWCQRVRRSDGEMQLWQAPGADGTSDRSQVALATRVVTAAEVATPGEIVTTIELNDERRNEIAARMVGEWLSLILVPTGGGTLFLYSSEGHAQPMELTITECRRR